MCVKRDPTNNNHNSPPILFACLTLTHLSFLFVLCPLGLYFWPPWGCSRPSWGRLGPIMVRPRNLCVCALSTFQEPPEEGWRQGRLRHHMRKNNNLHRKSLTLYNDTRRNPFHSAGMFRSQSQSEAPKKEDQPRYKPGAGAGAHQSTTCQDLCLRTWSRHETCCPCSL